MAHGSWLMAYGLCGVGGLGWADKNLAIAVLGKDQTVAQISVRPASPLAPTPLPVECCGDGCGVTAGLFAQHSTGRGERQ